MNVELLLQEEGNSILLRDGNWKQTLYYEIDSGDTYSGCAHLIILSKEITTDATAALIYLFQRLYEGSEALEKEDAALSAHDLLRWLVGAGYIGSLKGVYGDSTGSSEGVSPDLHVAANKVQAIIQELLQYKEGKMYKNGLEITPFIPFTAQEVKAVTAFKDKDDYLYFIETHMAWMYFSWGPSI